MADQISHEEIVRNFIKSKSVDFNALGKFVAEHGSSIAVSSRGDYGVRFGHYNILACFNIGPRVFENGGINPGNMAPDVTGRGG